MAESLSAWTPSFLEPDNVTKTSLYSGCSSKLVLTFTYENIKLISFIVK